MSSTALRAWLAIRGNWQGPLFPRFRGKYAATQMTRQPIRGDTISRVVKRPVRLIGLDPSAYGGHSLRAGCVTAAAEAGVSETIIMRRTGHKSVAMLSRYVRQASAFTVDSMARVL